MSTTTVKEIPQVVRKSKLWNPLSSDQLTAPLKRSRESLRESNDAMIKEAIDRGNLIVDLENGRVFSSKSNTPDRAMGTMTAKGYLRTAINLVHPGFPVAVMMHRVVCIAAHGLPDPERCFVNHKNGVKTDNRPSNLEWVSNAENQVHARRLGLVKSIGRRDGIRDSKGRFGFKSSATAGPAVLDGRVHDGFPEIGKTTAPAGRRNGDDDE
jgi:hypothetical protein